MTLCGTELWKSGWRAAQRGVCGKRCQIQAPGGEAQALLHPGTGLWLLGPNHPGSTCFRRCLVCGQCSTTPRQYPRHEGSSGAREVTWERTGEESQVSGQAPIAGERQLVLQFLKVLTWVLCRFLSPSTVEMAKRTQTGMLASTKNQPGGEGGKEG